MTQIRPTLLTALALLLLAGTAVPAAAEPEPSSDLLLPWFEVHLSSQRTTLFAVGNAADEAVDVKARVHTNWGIPVLERTLHLRAGEVRTVNLRDWIVAGNVPDPALRGVDLEHLQAALTGQLSPKDDLFYATQADPFDPELAVGYVTLRVQSTPRRDSLWGDYFWVDPEQDFAEGELLVDIDFTSGCGALCRTHRLRFLEGGGFDGGTQLVVWSSRRVQPAPDANAAFARLLAVSPFHREPGEQFDERLLELLPVQLVDVQELFLDEDFGWLDLETDEEIYVGVRYSADRRYSVTLQTWCIPHRTPDPQPAAIDIEKFTNGEDADEPTGPEVPPGGDVTWEYVVTNTGERPLTDIRVVDDQEGEIECPKTALGPGQSMTCTLTGKAPPTGEDDFQYANLATVTGTPPTGPDVTDDDPSHYWVEGQGGQGPPPTIDIEKSTNDEDADAGPGPELQVGQAVTWTYEVTNTSIEDVTITGISVIDDREGAVSCPETSLAKGESMTCTLTGVAVAGQYANVATVTGVGPAPDEIPVTDSDPSHYHAAVDPPPAAIDIEKATNGHDADQAPGPELQVGQAVTWTYVVTNTGQAGLTAVSVTDDREGAVSCPKSTLQPGESMTCTLSGIAADGDYANLGTVNGSSQEDGSPVSDSDPSHYHAMRIEGQGCTPGYWKNHTDSWPPTGFSPAQSVQSVFGAASAYPSHGSASLHQALSFQGGSGVEGAVGNLLRAAVAGLLNTAHDGVTYPRTTVMLISDVNAALASGDRDTMLMLASRIDSDNNLGCPLN